MDDEALKYRNGLAIAKWYGYKNLEHLPYQTLFQFLEIRGFHCIDGWYWIAADDEMAIKKRQQLAEEDKEFNE